MVGVSQPSVKARTLSCPNCGGNVEVRGFQHTRSVVCIQCLSVLDPTTPEIQILQRFEERLRVQPLIPLGTRGKVRGATYEVIGFQVRTITVEGVDYSWHEYLLFNPFQGFRYVTQYNGHWNDVTTLRALPSFTSVGGRKAATYLDATYRHFQTALARTTFVMGEFPWQVRVGEEVQVEDYIAPPRMLSAEITGNEVTWSLGEYWAGAEVWQAFQLPGKPPAATGVFANQPAPAAGGAASIWGAFFKLFLAWLVLLIGIRAFSDNREVFGAALRLAPNQQVVSDTFEIRGRTANAEIELKTEGYGYYRIALVNAETGRAKEFSRNVGTRDSVILPSVPAGRYYLRIDPDIEAGEGFPGQVTVRRDVPHTLWLWLALPLLLIPPIVTSAKRGGFESARWQESDYAG